MMVSASQRLLGPEASSGPSYGVELRLRHNTLWFTGMDFNPPRQRRRGQRSGDLEYAVPIFGADSVRLYAFWK